MGLQGGVTYFQSPIEAVSIGSLLAGLETEDQTEALRQMLMQRNPNFAAEDTGTQNQIIQQQVMPSIQSTMAPTDTISPFRAEDVYSPGQRILNVLGGAGTGILKGILPDERIEAPNSFDPLTRQAETITRVPTAFVSNVIGALFTGGAYNAAAGGVSANTRARKAEGDALRAGNYEIARSIRDATAPATALGAGYGFAGARIPGAVGIGAGTKILTGAGMGYTQGLAGQALDRYAESGTVDPTKLDYTPGLDTLLGGAIPAGIHYTPRLARSLRNSDNAHDVIQAGLTRAAAKVGKAAVKLNRVGRKAQSGHMGFKPTENPPEGLPLQGDFQRGVTERQYAGAKTGETAPMVSTSAMQAEATQAVGKAIDEGNPRVIQGWISQFENGGDDLRANAVRQGALEPTNFERLDPTTQEAILTSHQEAASRTGRELQSFQNNPLYRAREEFLDAALSDKPDKPPTGVNAAGEEVKEVVEDSFKELFSILVGAFRFTSRRARRTRGESNVPERVTRTAPAPKQPKARGEKPFKLRLKTLDETKTEARQLEQKRKRLESALAKENKKAAPNTERVRQLKLGLGAVERRETRIKMLLARALAEDPTEPRAPRSKVTVNLTSEQQSVEQFAKERLRAKNYIRRRLETAGGTRKPVVKKPYQFTKTERELVEKLDAQQKADRQNVLKMNVKRVKELTANQALEKQRLAMKKAHDNELNARRREAMRALTTLEKQLNVQTKLSLGVKRTARAVSTEALATLSPEELAYYYDMVARKNRTMLFEKLERRLAAGERVGVRAKGESLDELYKRMEPLMTQGERQAYGARKTAIGRRRFLSQLNRKKTPATRRTVLDRLVEAQGHDLLNATTPEVLDALVGRAKRATVMHGDDWKQLNAYITAATDPTLTPRDARRAHAMLDRFIFDHQSHSLLRKWITFRTQGLLLQSLTQMRNWLDMGSYWVHYRGPHAALRELGEFAYSKLYQKEYEGAGERGLIIRRSKETKEFYKQNELTAKDEAQNILFDVRHGTNTARNWSGDVFRPAGLDAGPLHTKSDGQIGEALRSTDKAVGGTIRAIIGGGDRLAYASVYEASLTKEIEIYKRVTGDLPDPKSDIYANMRKIAEQEAEQATLTNEGGVANLLTGTRKKITELVDKGLKLEEKDSTNAGALVLPFTHVVGNMALRPLEMVPVAGALGIRFNRNFQADLSKVPAYNRNAFGQIFASQITGLVLTGAAGGMGNQMMYAAGYYGAFQIGPRDKSIAVEETREDAGYRRGSVNVTAFSRYFKSGDPEDFIAQPGDTTFYVMGLSTWSMPMLYMTAPGREDARNGVAYNPRANITDIPRNAATGALSMFTENDALSGFTRPIGRVANARNPDTGEPDPLGTGIPAVISDVIGFKLPGSDLAPQPVRAPRNALEQVESRIPFVDQLVPERLDTEGKVKRRKGLLDTVGDTENFPGFMNRLRAETGKANHLLGPLPKKLTASDGGQEVTVNLTKAQRQGAERALKAQYVGLVEMVRGHEQFDTLAPDQQVHVLSRVKNDMLRAYMARNFDKPITQASYSMEGGVNLHTDDAPGAKALYNGRVDYNAIIDLYIGNATKDEVNQEVTRQLRQQIGDNPLLNNGGE